MAQTTPHKATANAGAEDVWTDPTAGHPDPYRWRSIGAAALMSVTLPVVILTVAIGTGRPSPGAGGQGGSLVSHADSPTLAGQRVYQSTCMVCHGPDANGVPMLGKPLRNSEFVQTHSDDDLFQLIAEGRAPTDPANTSGILMPPRGAQNLGDEQIQSAIAYLRSIQDPDAPHASVEAWVRPRGEDGAAPVAAIELTDHPGYDLFVTSCAACHGQGAQGMEGLGLPLTTSGFVRGKSDKELINFIKMGRPSWDENNTTGIDMPPKGGNPAITDEQLQSIIEYIRALQEQAMGS